MGRKITKDNFRNHLGYITDDNRIHICGYEGNKVLFQAHGSEKVRKVKIYESTKGVYFNVNQERVYIVKF